MRLSAAEDLGLGRGALDAGPHPVDVVDDQEDHRQVPESRKVQGLVPGAHVDRALTELTEHRLLFALAHETERQPGGDRQLTSDYAPAAEVAALGIEQVHRATAAVGAAVFPAEELGHHALGRQAAGECHAVRAIAGDEQVAVLEGRDGAHRSGLLADREVAVTTDPRELVLALGLGLEAADQQHPLVMAKQRRVGLRSAAQVELCSGLVDRGGRLRGELGPAISEPADGFLELAKSGTRGPPEVRQALRSEDQQSEAEHNGNLGGSKGHELSFLSVGAGLGRLNRPSSVRRSRTGSGR
jgi:hypothetical protein